MGRIKAKSHSFFFAINRPSASELEQKYPEFSVSKKTKLCDLMTQYGSDKGRGWHNYTRVYQPLFAGLNVQHLFEMGIGTNNTHLPYNMGLEGKAGASLRAWKAYFPAAQISGADIDENSLFNEDRISTWPCDQRSIDSIKQLWDHIGVEAFDVIIDDGVHEFAVNQLFFEHSIHKLNKGGIYIVEDIQNIELANWKEYIEQDCMERFPHLLFRICSVPNVQNALDNNLLIIYSMKD